MTAERSHRPPPPLHADDSIPGKRLALVGAAVVVVTLASIAISTAMLRAQDPTSSSVHPVAPPTGTVERSLVRDTDRGGDMKAAQRAYLGTYGWVDRDAGIARIPIERAMEMVVEGAK